MPRVSEKERAVRGKTMLNASLYKQDSFYTNGMSDVLGVEANDRVINEWTSVDVFTAVRRRQEGLQCFCLFTLPSW